MQPVQQSGRNCRPLHYPSGTAIARLRGSEERTGAGKEEYMDEARSNAGFQPDQPVAQHRFAARRWMRIGLTGRMFLLVVIAVLPALAIQGVNEYTLRSSREDDIRERVIQITKQFGEEMKEVREGASQLLIALGEIDALQDRKTQACNGILANLKSHFESYSRLGAADLNGNIFCSSGPLGDTSV